jgi:hypothetical protein
MNNSVNKEKLVFRKEKAKLTSILPKNILIEQVRCISAPQKGKQIIDIAVVVPEGKVKDCISKLEKTGFRHDSKNKPSDFVQRILVSKSDKNGKPVYLTLGPNSLNSFHSFREYLHVHSAMNLGTR